MCLHLIRMRWKAYGLYPPKCHINNLKNNEEIVLDTIITHQNSKTYLLSYQTATMGPSSSNPPITSCNCQRSWSWLQSNRLPSTSHQFSKSTISNWPNKKKKKNKQTNKKTTFSKSNQNQWCRKQCHGVWGEGTDCGNGGYQWRIEVVSLNLEFLIVRTEKRKVRPHPYKI